MDFAHPPYYCFTLAKRILKFAKFSNLYYHHTQFQDSTLRGASVFPTSWVHITVTYYSW